MLGRAVAGDAKTPPVIHLQRSGFEIIQDRWLEHRAIVETNRPEKDAIKSTPRRISG